MSGGQVGLRFDPVGGGQFKQAVKQIIEAESQPIKTLEARKAKEDARMKLFQEFKSKFSGIQKSVAELTNFRKFRELKVDLGDGANLMSVTLDKEKAEPGQYELEIEELALRTSVISNGFENPEEPVLGMGFINLDLPDGESYEIYVDQDNSSLRGVATLINRQPNSPVRASVIKDASEPEAPWKIILTAKKDGEGQQIDFPDFNFVDGDFYIEDDREAQNARIIVDGFEIETESNDVTDFLPGVNIHLKQAKSDFPFVMTITEDYQKIDAKMKAMVDQINQVLQFIVKQNTIDEKSDTSTTFAGDVGLQSMEFQIRNLIHQPYAAAFADTDDPPLMYLSDFGIEFDRSGMLLFKEERFNKTLEKDFELMSQAISGPDGFANQLKNLFDGYIRPGDGTLGIKERGLQSRIKQIDEQIDQRTRVLDQRKQAITDRFARLESTLGNLQRQQQYLSATLPGAGAANPIAQLLGG